MKKYTVKSGDTLSNIAKRFYNDAMKYIEIAQTNQILFPYELAIGKELFLPGLSDTSDGLPTNNTASGVSNSPNQSNKITFTTDLLKKMLPNAAILDLDKYLGALNTELVKFNISTPLRIAHFIAQIAHESGNFRYSSENLYYRAEALKSIFGKYFPTDQLAQEYSRQPIKIANRVYANRLGNGDENSGEGWKYRGRGLIQLSGKENYINCGTALGIDLTNHPELLSDNPHAAVAAAGWYWDFKKLNTFADQDDITTITKRINGGLYALKERQANLVSAKTALGI